MLEENKSRLTTDIFDKCYVDHFFPVNEEILNYYLEPIFTSPAGPYMMFAGQRMLTWSINDYLGLSLDPRIKKIALDAVQTWGLTAPMSARMIAGNTPIHIQFEKEMARHCQFESAFLSSWGYLGAIGAITAMIGQNDVILMDRLAHACLVDAAILSQHKSGKKIRVFRHNDMADLEQQLQQVVKKEKGGALIISEGVFGMHSDLGCLPELCALKNKYGARLFIDDSHGFGVMGEQGLGTAEHFGVQQDIDIYFTAFSKALVSNGGVTLANEKVIKFMRVNSRQNMMTAGLPIAAAYQLIATLNIIKTEFTERRQQLWRVAKQLQQGLAAEGFDIGKPKSPITPVRMEGDLVKLKTVLHTLREKFNIFVSGVAYPVIPRNSIILRLVPTASHTSEDVQKTLTAFKSIKDLMI